MRHYFPFGQVYQIVIENDVPKKRDELEKQGQRITKISYFMSQGKIYAAVYYVKRENNPLETIEDLIIEGSL